MAIQTFWQPSVGSSTMGRKRVKKKKAAVPKADAAVEEEAPAERTGYVVTLITPFDEQGAIDYEAFVALVEWHVSNGCAGVFTPCLSSEMFDLSAEERIALAKCAKEAAAGRCAVYATGGIGKGVEAKAADVNAIAPHCDAVVIVTSLLAGEGYDDAIWLSNAERLAALTDANLGLYECPVPFKRLLTPAMVRTLAATNRYTFLKDTSCDLAQIRAKLDAAVGSRFRIFNANVETLLPSLEAGCAGFCGISANFYPHLHAWLCLHWENPALADCARRIQDFLSLAEAAVCVNYPRSAKAYLRSTYGLEATERCRVPRPAFLPHQYEALAAMARSQRSLSASLGIVERTPIGGVAVAGAAPPPPPPPLLPPPPPGAAAAGGSEAAAAGEALYVPTAAAWRSLLARVSALEA